MPAYLAMVEGDEGYVGGVYFTPQAIHARRAVCDQWQDGELTGAIVKRMRHFDRYEEAGAVPMRDMIYENWWSECYNCGVKLTLDEQYDADDNEFYIDPDKVVGNFGGATFCCQECKDDSERKRHEDNHIKAQLLNRMQANIEAMFGAEGITYADDFYAYIKRDQDIPYVLSAQLRFHIPGDCWGGVTYSYDNEGNKGEPKYSISYPRGDSEVVKAFYKERTGIVL